MRVPFVDLTADWEPYRADALRRIEQVFRHGHFVAGPEVSTLEQAIADDLGGAHVAACASGTTALLMSMMALGIGPGDEVVVPAFTFPAPAECALILGAEPVLADVDVPTGHVSPASVAAAIGPRTRAVVAVSLYGVPIDDIALRRVTDPHGLPLIEDAAQSYGARRGGRPSGLLGDVGCYSFFPTKGFGGAGDGGAVVTKDEALAKRIVQIRDHGQQAKYNHVRPGLNGRMSSIAAAALLARRAGWSGGLRARRQAAARYGTALAALRAGELLDFHQTAGDVETAGSHFTVLVTERDRVAARMAAQGVQTAVHYPRPLHGQPAFSSRRRAGRLSGAEQLAATALCLPIRSGLTAAEQDLVCAALTDQQPV